MNARPGELVAVGAGIAYLAALSWAIGSASYDVWGALVVAPVYGVIGVTFVRRFFRGTLQPLASVMAWGLLIKLAGSLARYWVGFEAYDGGIDAGRYHRFAAAAAGQVWSGDESIVSVIPRNTGTAFLEHFTAFTYTLTGSSQLAGFLTFSFLAYIGTILIVKAAAIAIPAMATRRYAWMCVLFPSIVYWPSSIGKEAPILLGLGLATYGIAVMFTYGRWMVSVAMIAIGLGFTSLIRPHVAGIWMAAAIPGLVVSLVRRSQSAAKGQRKVSRFGTVFVLLLAAGGLALIASATVRYLAPDSESVTPDSLTEILDETTRRTSDAGSNFAPPAVNSPADWPYAALRTLTRPLPHEARSAAQLVSAAEMAALLGIYVVSWRRLRNLPRLLISNPYVTFVVTAVFLTGLAYSSFANLGVLTRQKSLILPFLTLLPCLPERAARRPIVEGDRQLDGGTIRESRVGSIGSTPRSADSARPKELDDIWA